MQLADIMWVRVALVAALLGLALGQKLLSVRFSPTFSLPRAFLVGCAMVSIGVLVFLFVNHIGFPANLDLMEGTILQHYRRALAGEYIYPEPSTEYAPLAYNCLYYFISVPFGWILGAS